MARKRAAVLLSLAALVLAVAPAALAGNAGFGPPPPASPSGAHISTLYWIVFAIVATIFVLVEAALVLFIVRYRRRPGQADGEGAQVHGNTRLEIIWTAIPVLILVAIAVVTFVTVPKVNATPGPGSDALVVKVDAHQFYWQYEYPNGAISIDRLRLPEGRTASLHLTSPDVIHSWWVPELTGKRDAIPGRVNVLNFKPDKLGVFHGQCAEFCGVFHAIMRTEVEVMPAADFDAWVAGEQRSQQGADSDLGQQTWDGVCAKCHGLSAEGDYGPPIKGNGTLTNKEALTRLLHEGQNLDTIPGHMPPVGLGWSEQQVDALIAFMEKAGIAKAPATTEGSE